jgi:hypothetical protein
MSTVTRPRRTTPVVNRLHRGTSPRPPDGPDGSRRRRQLIRRRAAVVVAGVAALITILVVVLLSRSGVAPPATGAAQVVPADALAYVHLSTDPGRPSVRQAEAVARRFPDYPLAYAAVVDRLGAIVGGSGNFANEVRPWLGNEAAFALLPTPDGSASMLIVLGVKKAARARAFVTRAGAVALSAEVGVRILRYASGTELAFVRHYLVVGSDAGVRAAIDAAAGRARSLADDAVYARASAGEPAGRLLDAYVPAAGMRGLLESRGGVAGAIGLLLDRPDLQGTAMSVSAAPGEADVWIHSALVAKPGSHPLTFTPTLGSILPAGSTLMLDVDGLNRAAPQLLRAAATAGFAGGVAPLLARLGAALTAEGVNVHKIDSIFAGETAVALSPGPSPSLLIVARTANQAATQTELAGLEGPLTALFPAPTSGPGQIAGLDDQQVGGVTVHELGLGSGLQIDYAVWNGLVVVSTSVRAIDQVVSRGHSLADEQAYQTALADRPAQLSSVLFTDFSQLLGLGEQIGLTSGTRVRELLPDLTKVRTIGLSSTSGGRDTTTELRLEIP